MGKLVQGSTRRMVKHEAAGQRGTLLVLPSAPTALEPALAPEAPPAPLVAGALALLEAPAVECEAVVRPLARRRQILIVEDDARTVDVLRNALELDGDPGWDIASASDGLRALELAVRVPPDVLLLDVWLPGLDGAEVYRRLRAAGANSRTRVLFLSAGTALDLAQRGINDGVLLRKPFALPELVALVRALLAD